MSTRPMSAGALGALDTAMAEMRGADGVIEKKNQAAIRELFQSMRRIPWQPASLVSLHPWPLTAQGVMFNDLRINPAPMPDDERFDHITLENGHVIGFQHHVFSHWAKNMKPNDAGQHEFTAVMPLDLALDFIVQHQNGRTIGGLICYEGAKPPREALKDASVEAWIQGDPTGTRLPPMSLAQALKDAHEIQIREYLSMFDQAEEANANKAVWSQRSITQKHRRVARMLKMWGVIAVEPTWVNAQRNPLATAPVVCKSCGAESKPGAVRCTNGSCTYIFDPFNAFKDLVIGLDTPGAHLAFRRLSKEQVDDLIGLGVFSESDLEDEDEEGDQKVPKTNKGGKGPKKSQV